MYLIVCTYLLKRGYPAGVRKTSKDLDELWDQGNISLFTQQVHNLKKVCMNSVRGT